MFGQKFFPYSTLQELNLDWIIAKVKELNERVDNISEEIAADVIPIVEEYVDTQVQEIIEEFNALKEDFNTLSKLGEKSSHPRSVAAGAVAVAIAPSTSTCGRESLSDIFI